MSRSLVTRADPWAAAATPPMTTNLIFLRVSPRSIVAKLILWPLHVPDERGICLERLQSLRGTAVERRAQQPDIEAIAGGVADGVACTPRRSSTTPWCLQQKRAREIGEEDGLVPRQIDDKRG